MTEEHLKYLIDHYLQGHISPREEEELMAFYERFQQGKEHWATPEMGDFEETRAKIFRQIQSNIIAFEKPKQKKGYWKYIAAASVMTIIGLSFWFSQSRKPVPENLKNSSGLILFDGTVINFDHYQTGDTISQSGATLIKLDSATVSYAFSPSSSATSAQQSNTFSIAKGKLLTVKLADSSKIYLNANSNLVVPATFSKLSRSVTLTGEAYFEIAKDKTHPFKILTNNQQIDVLGTHFNVKAYPAWPIKTTLVEGRVRVTNTQIAGSQAQKYLLPGEQSIVKADSIKVEKVEIENELAWKNGFFIFHEDNIRSVMEDLSRWYDIDVSYNLDTEGLFISGRISKSKSLSETLQVLKLANNINFKLNGRRLVIMK
ncbi:FecR domain-containing protein [Pedobacter sp. KR3-3]|uniref:FecR domain-containing protein n=1 Tax=Pedobacter albus TaxID=3113905 RepID=A0ABU7I6P0_9SPHI|nr:FecR domain-containing protein [Pedobacter sp. KR3-3]MEE1945022.1 FecR domain-containing protein [Pedobacter sp. KR3-3]